MELVEELEKLISVHGKHKINRALFEMWRRDEEEKKKAQLAKGTPA